MGKVVTKYLSDEEAHSLKGFCNENQCTQYSALKTAVKQLLYRPVESVYDDTWVDDTGVDETPENDPELTEDTEEIEEIEENNTEEPVARMIRILRERRKKQEPSTDF